MGWGGHEPCMAERQHLLPLSHRLDPPFLLSSLPRPHFRFALLYSEALILLSQTRKATKCQTLSSLLPTFS